MLLNKWLTLVDIKKLMIKKTRINSGFLFLRNVLASY